MNQLAVLAPLCMIACVTDPEPLTDVAQELSASELDSLVLRYCGMLRDGVTHYDGLTGTYQRWDQAGLEEPVRLSLVATHGQPDATGTFTGTYKTATGAPAAYAGQFAAIPDNPAIGATLALDTDGDPGYDQVYFVLALRRFFGQVYGICLVGGDHPFLLSRTYL